MRHTNNFDFLRLLFAVWVIITHSYPLTGQPEQDLLWKITNGQTAFSYISVRGFFAISGYLIIQSLLRSNNLMDYYWKRILRIFPALFVVLLFSTIACYFAYNGTTPYWGNLSTYTYLPRNMVFFTEMYQDQGTIEGIFSTNRYGTPINGSLWTIKMEFFAYMMVSLLFVFRKNRKMLIVLVLIVTVYLQIMAPFFINRGKNYNFLARIFHLSHHQMQDVYSFFTMGSLLALLEIEKLKKKTLTTIFLVSLGALVVATCLGFFRYTHYFLLPIVCISFGISSWRYINSIGSKIGDLSYGIYLFGFPIQQLIEYFLKPTPLEMMLYALPVVIILAYLSWSFVEKKALSYKNLFK